MRKTIPFILPFFLLFLFGGCVPTSKEGAKNPQNAKTSIVKLPLCTDCITTAEAAKNIGKIVKVSGVVKKITLVDWEKGQPCFIDLDEVFPNNVFNVVVFKNNHTKFSDFKVFEGKTIAVTGKVKIRRFAGNAQYPPTTYPQIEIKNVEQIEILD